MTPKNFVYLAAATAVSVLLAIVSFASNNQWGTGRPAGDKLLPGLADAVRDVARIEIRQGDDTLVLEKTDGGWAVKTRAGYPVDARKVGTLLVALGEAELVEPKTRKPERYAALELEDPAGKDAKSRLVRLADAKGNTLQEVVIGKKRFSGYGAGKTGGTYVRRPDDPQTWLANAELDASVAVKDWVKTSILSMDAAKISRVSIEIPGEQALTAERPAARPKDAKADVKDAKQDAKDAKADAKDVKQDAKNAKADVKNAKADAKDAKADAKDTKAPKWTHPPFQAAKLAFVGFPPEGKKLKDEGAAEAIARAVSSIELEDVRKLAAPPADAGVSVVKIESEDGATTTLRLRKEGDSHWLSVTATGQGDANKAAEEITARTQGWEFKIPSYKVNAILKKRAELVETPAS